MWARLTHELGSWPTYVCKMTHARSFGSYWPTMAIHFCSVYLIKGTIDILLKLWGNNSLSITHISRTTHFMSNNNLFNHLVKDNVRLYQNIKNYVEIHGDFKVKGLNKITVMRITYDNNLCSILMEGQSSTLFLK